MIELFKFVTKSFIPLDNLGSSNNRAADESLVEHKMFSQNQLNHSPPIPASTVNSYTNGIPTIPQISTPTQFDFFIYFRQQQNRMLGQLQPMPISRQLHGDQDEKNQRMSTLFRQIDYLLPRRHRYFCKPYKIDCQLNEVPLLLRDMEDYRQLLAAESKKLLSYLHDYQSDGILSSLIASTMRFFEEFAAQNARIAAKMAKREQAQVKSEVKHGKCSACSKMLSQYRVEQMREQLQLNRFEDHYNLFNVDHLSFSELASLQRQSKALLQGELTQQNQFLYQGGCISLEQYEQVLNLLGSDLHQKNNSIQKIIQYLSKTDSRLLGQEKGKVWQGEEELKFLDAMVYGDVIKQRLKDLIRLSFKRYIKYKIYKRKNAEIQVNLKEADVIRQLERDKKHLKNRIFLLCTEKERTIKDYQNRLKTAHLQLQSNASQFRERMENAAAQALQMSQKFAQERHLHEFHKLELERLKNEYTHLLAVVNRRSVNQKQKQKDSKSSRSSKRASSRKSRKEKPKIAMKRQFNSFADMTHIQSENEIDNDSGKSLKKLKGKEDLNKKISAGEVIKTNNSLKEIGKFHSYSKIQEKQEDEENETAPVTFKELKRKTSRFKALMNHFNSNATLQHQASKKNIEKSYDASLNAICQSLLENPLTPAPTTQKQITCKQQKQSRYQIIYRLFESERSSQQLSLTFPNFLKLYNDFITKITLQKVLRRSSSLKSRASRLGSNQERSQNSHTLKSIDQQPVKESISKAGSKGSQRMRDSSRLQPIQKKSQYYLKKVTKSRAQFDFKNHSRTAEHTQRTEHLVSIKDVQIQSSNSDKSNILYSCLTDENFNDMFMGQASTMNFQSETRQGQQPIPIENQLLMKISAQLAIMHIKSPKYYQQVRVVLSHPNEAVKRQPITVFNKQTVNELKNSIKAMIRLHRKCKKPTGMTECSHLQHFLKKTRQLSTGNTSLKVVQNEVFQ